MPALATPLSPLEIRVLGVLSEKQRTVPDSYPLTLNSLLAGCNQRTSRQPIMEVSEAQAQLALESLKRYSLVTESSGGRAYRYGHNMVGGVRVPSQSIALLTALMLRGPQTAGELRIACDRMHNFADISSVEAFLDELAERPAGALVVKLGRPPGAREQGWAHLLGEAPSAQELPQTAPFDVAPVASGDITLDEVATLKARVSRLEQELAATRTALQRVCAELGMPKDLWSQGTES